MSNAQGWNLSARLIAKHFGALGDKLSGMIANFDPEAATEADRDALAAGLKESAVQMAKARRAFDKEHEDVVKLQALIANDERAAGNLLQQLNDKLIDEETVTIFCDELEANKARLPQEQQEEVNAKAYMDEVQSLVDGLSKQLEEFDRIAKKTLNELAQARAAEALQQQRMERQAQMDAMKSGLNRTSTALGALARKTEQVRNNAEGMKIVADIEQKPLDRQAAVDAARQAAMHGAVPAESAAARLARLSGAAPANEPAIS